MYLLIIPLQDSLYGEHTEHNAYYILPLYYHDAKERRNKYMYVLIG